MVSQKPNCPFICSFFNLVSRPHSSQRGFPNNCMQIHMKSLEKIALRKKLINYSVMFCICTIYVSVIWCIVCMKRHLYHHHVCFRNFRQPNEDDVVNDEPTLENVINDLDDIMEAAGM